jgi:DNA/RNA-binding domain of Phe-tRNA-synthetase-like protein
MSADRPTEARRTPEQPVSPAAGHVRGWRDPVVDQELPGLDLAQLALDAAVRRSLTGASPAAVLERLAHLSDRWRGARAVQVRQEAIPAAYRALFRQIGLDPDRTRTPLEALVLERMLDGGFLSRGLLADILAAALIDTGVPVWALDDDRLDGLLGIRLSREQERLGRAEHAPVLGPGRLVIADSTAAVAILFGMSAPGCEPRARTRRLRLFAVRAPGVPDLHVEEALFQCRSLLEGVA